MFSRSYRTTALTSRSTLLSTRSHLRHYTVQADKTTSESASDKTATPEDDSTAKLKVKDDEISDLTVRDHPSDGVLT